MRMKLYRIRFHGEAEVWGETPEEAKSGFRSQAETMDEDDLIIDLVEEEVEGKSPEHYAEMQKKREEFNAAYASLVDAFFIRPPRRS